MSAHQFSCADKNQIRDSSRRLLQRWLIAVRPLHVARPDRRQFTLVLNNLKLATQPLFGAANQKQGPQRMDRGSLPANDLADIIRIEPKLVNGGLPMLDRR